MKQVRNTGSLKIATKKTHAYYQEKTSKICSTHKEGGLRKLNPHRAYWGQERQGKTVNHLLDKLGGMDGGIGTGSFSKGRKTPKYYKE